MNQFISVFSLLVLIGVVVIQQVSADLKEVECKGQKYEISEEHQANMKECLSKIGVSSIKELTGGNAGCFSRCSMVQKGLIDDSGKPHKEKIMNLMDEHIPEPIRAEWKSAIEICLDNEGSKIDMKDETTCSSFMPLTMCVHTAFMKICKP